MGASKNIVASFLILLTVVVILFCPSLVFNLFAIILIQMALFEYFTFTKVSNIYLGVVLGAAISISFLSNSLPLAATTFTAIAAFYIGFLVFMRKLPSYDKEMTVLIGWLYISWLMSFVILIRLHENGSHIVFFLFFLTAFRNIGAGMLGKLVRGHSLSIVSPNKTIEGAFIGFVSATLLAYLIYLIFPDWIEIFDLMVMAILIGILGQVGDLVASMFKRIAGVKESSTFLGGQGGFLDTIDSFAFTAPAIYIYYVLKPILFG